MDFSGFIDAHTSRRKCFSEISLSPSARNLLVHASGVCILKRGGPSQKFHSAAHLDDKKNDPKKDRKGKVDQEISFRFFQGFMYLAGVSFCWSFFCGAFGAWNRFFSYCNQKLKN